MSVNVMFGGESMYLLVVVVLVCPFFFLLKLETGLVCLCSWRCVLVVTALFSGVFPSLEK